MTSGVFGIGTSALLAYQRALSTTGHNIANVGTEGYSRQRVDLAVRNPQFSGAGYFGQGVDIDGVNRITDQFVQRQLMDNTSGAGRQQVFYQYAQRADNLLADAEAGLSPVLQQFFAAVQDVATIRPRPRRGRCCSARARRSAIVSPLCSGAWMSSASWWKARSARPSRTSTA